MNPSTIRRHIKRMEEEGLMQRIVRLDKKGGQLSNFYSFDGLIEKMLPHAHATLDLKQTQQTDCGRLLWVLLRSEIRIHYPGGKRKADD